MNFISDNAYGVAPEILAALARANDGKASVNEDNLEVCILEKARIGRKFRRLDADELRQHLGG